MQIEERLQQLFAHLGIDRAHVAARNPGDWARFASADPAVFASLTLVAPPGINPAAKPLASRLLAVHGDKGPQAASTEKDRADLPQAECLTLRDFEALGWTDLLAERTDEIGAAMIQFLDSHPIGDAMATTDLPAEGEVAGIRYRIRGSGEPLVLLPLFLAPSQWEPLIPMLAERFCTITLGGERLGAMRILEDRGKAPGYLDMMKAVFDEASPRPGETILEVGSGSGVLDRWLAEYTGRRNPITGVDINRYFLSEAKALASKAGLADLLTYEPGSAEDLPFPDDRWDLSFSVTVIEEVDADRMLTEMVRVTRPGGRVAVVARALDVPMYSPLPLEAELLAKVAAPGVFGTRAANGCADSSLYARARSAGLRDLRLFPHLTTFDGRDAGVLEFIRPAILDKLEPAETEAYLAAWAKAERDGTLLVVWPHHCVVGTC